MRIVYAIAFVLMSLSACHSDKSMTLKKDETLVSTKNKTPDDTTDKGSYIISAPVVAKTFVNKGGKTTGHQEYYIQRSVQDYFIKFCESQVSREDIASRLSDNEFAINTLKMEVEFREGNWDICEDDPEHIQSRMGSYVVIKKIIE